MDSVFRKKKKSVYRVVDTLFQGESQIFPWASDEELRFVVLSVIHRPCLAVP